MTKEQIQFYLVQINKKQIPVEGFRDTKEYKILYNQGLDIVLVLQDYLSVKDFLPKQYILILLEDILQEKPEIQENSNLDSQVNSWIKFLQQANTQQNNEEE
jgi:hypothetical protein